MEDREITEIAVVVTEVDLIRTKYHNDQYHDELHTPQGMFLLRGSDNHIENHAVLYLRRAADRPDWFGDLPNTAKSFSLTGREEDCWLWEVVK